MAFLREIKVKRKSGEVYSWWVVIKAFWDKERRKVRHKVIQNLGHLTSNQVKQVKLLLSFKELPEDSFFTSWKQIKARGSYEFLIPVILDKLWHLWELEKATDTKQTQKVSTSVMSEILAINRAISPSSDLKVCNWYEDTILPKLFNVEAELINPTRIYRTLDRILEREKQIQDHLKNKIKDLGFDDFSVVFYDITSSYFEGKSCSLAEFGLSRDNQKNKPQLLLALAVTKEGLPFYWEILPGSVHDCLTVKQTVTSFKRKFKLENTIVVMDKGMVSQDNLEFLEREGFFYIATISRSSVKKISSFPRDILTKLGEELEEGEKKNYDLTEIMKNYPYFTYFSPRVYFHELNKDGKRRYILCFNPEKFLEERKQREKKLSSIVAYLERWNKKLSSSQKSKNKELLSKEIYSYLKKRKAENLFIIKLIRERKKVRKKFITIYQIDYQVRQDKLENLKLSDGIYCIISNLSEERTSSFLIYSYQQRRKVEVAFSYLKGFTEIRPFYHQKEGRVKAHILVCILGYLLQTTVEYLLKKGGYHITFQDFLQRVNRVKVVEVEIENVKRKGFKLTEIPQEIRYFLKVLNSEEIISENFLERIGKKMI